MKVSELLGIPLAKIYGVITFYHFYRSTLGHQTAFIRRSLFDRYGLYDESLHIVSDWKWFIQVIALGGEVTTYADLDIVYYDMTGISQRELSLHWQERKQVLSYILPARILADYRIWNFDVEQMNRLRRFPWAYKLVWFQERCLFKWEKWTKPRKKKKDREKSDKLVAGNQNVSTGVELVSNRLLPLTFDWQNV